METLAQAVLPFKLETTEELLTANAGLALFGEFIRGLGLSRWLAQEMPKPGSGRGYESGAYVTPLVLILAGGGRSLEDLRTLKGDTALATVLKQQAVPSTDAVGDWLRRTGEEAGLAGLGRINQRIAATRIRQSGITAHTLDGDSSQIGKPASAEVYYAMAVADVIGKLRTKLETGLSTGDANVRLARYGANVLPKAKGDTAWTLLWRQINSPLIWVLIASGFVAMLVDPIDGIKNGLVILAVVVLNTLIGFVQEFKAGKAIEALSKMVPENVTALRDGKKATPWPGPT